MRNWTIKEAVEVINANQDQEAIKEIAKHFPQFFMAVCKNDIVALTQAMNDKFTVRRLQFGVVDAGNDDESEDTAPKTSGKKSAEAEVDDSDLESLSTKQLMALCDKRGIKVPHYGKNKQFYLDALQGGVDEEPETDAAEEEDAYEGKSAMELYKLCKKRGIKVEPKKASKVYVAALKKADAEAAQAEDDVDDEDWGDDKKEAPAPKKPAKSANKKAPAKVEEEDSDDDDEWDI